MSCFLSQVHVCLKDEIHMRVNIKTTTDVEREEYHQPVYVKDTTIATNEQSFFRRRVRPCEKNVLQELDGMQHPQSEQVKIGSAEHQSFLELQTVHLTLYLTVIHS